MENEVIMKLANSVWLADFGRDNSGYYIEMGWPKPARIYFGKQILRVTYGNSNTDVEIQVKNFEQGYGVSILTIPTTEEQRREFFQCLAQHQYEMADYGSPYRSGSSWIFGDYPCLWNGVLVEHALDYYYNPHVEEVKALESGGKPHKYFELPKLITHEDGRCTFKFVSPDWGGYDVERVAIELKSVDDLIELLKGGKLNHV